MLTAFEVSVLGRVDHVLRSSTPLLEEQQSERLLEDVVCVEKCGSDLPEAEKEWLQIRNKRIKPAMEALLGKKLDKVPVLAIFSSGGGVRAMIAVLGALEGLGSNPDETTAQPRENRVGKVGHFGHLHVFGWMQWILLGSICADEKRGKIASRYRHKHERGQEVCFSCLLLFSLAQVLAQTRDELRARLAGPLVESIGEATKQVLKRAARKIALLHSLSLVSVRCCCICDRG